ncbi:sigma-70 family RNA polymerase sigma factor [Ruminococcus sp.]|uniref:RNA polymerase sigma factor n=1 Tax=Ruminococcus sp. TaxID=41978 RepID=UPI0025F80DFD|nr:sigma-70 family RNA polymerase sigma factor [Ruminococcus sp.]
MSSDMEQYYRENGRKVFLYLMTLCGNADTAEELTQETFYRALRSLKKYKGDSSVYTWLCSIARNAWLEELRKRRKHTSEEITELIEDTSPRPDEEAESEDSRIRLLKRIHSLPETEKEIILLRASQELSFREIGEIFGKSENWARVTYYRAKQKLADSR